MATIVYERKIGLAASVLKKVQLFVLRIEYYLMNSINLP